MIVRFVAVWLAFLLVLLVVRLVLGVALRLRERRRLVAEWEAGAAEGRLARDREGFVEEGMALYDRSLRKRLLWGVVVGPVAALALLLYLINVA